MMAVEILLGSKRRWRSDDEEYRFSSSVRRKVEIWDASFLKNKSPWCSDYENEA